MNRSMDGPRLVIIGAGVAGLAAGCYAARSGYRTTILEMHDLPGGLCTSWRRKGYLFDGSVAGLAGTSPEMPVYRLWQDLGVIGSCPLYDTEDFGSVLSPDGRLVTVYTDVDRLEAEFLAAFPADAAAVREFCSAVRACRRVDIPFRTEGGPAQALATLRSAPASLRALPALLNYGRVTLREFTRKLTDPFCATVFNNLVHFGGPDVPLLTVLLPLAYADRRAAGIPLHGWLSFAQAIERRFRQLGGELRYDSRVVGLTTADGQVTGVRLATDEVVTAERVLSAADGRFTHGVLLGQPKREVDALYDSRHLSDQPVQVNLGVARDWTSGAVTYQLPGRPSVAGRRQSRLTVHSKHYDPDAAPPGKSALTAFLESGYDFWRALAADRPAYEAEKRRCADLVIATVERHRPGFADAIEVVDVSTPLTRERYTGNWMGAMQARRPDASMVRSLLRGGPRYDHPGLAGFFMAGQWVESWGGITTAAQSGRNAVRALCRKDGARFAY
jgi:phytoene dehydrogenase-like protein